MPSQSHWNKSTSTRETTHSAWEVQLSMKRHERVPIKQRQAYMLQFARDRQARIYIMEIAWGLVRKIAEAVVLLQQDRKSVV